MEKKKDSALILRGPLGLVKRSESREDLIEPVADIFETPESFIVKLDMPGSSKDGIQVRVESKVLSVKGAVKSLHRERMNMLMREIVQLHYYREFHISDGLEHDRIEAQFEKGVLTLILPKSDKLKSRHIPIL